MSSSGGATSRGTRSSRHKSKAEGDVQLPASASTVATGPAVIQTVASRASSVRGTRAARSSASVAVDARSRQLPTGSTEAPSAALSSPRISREVAGLAYSGGFNSATKSSGGRVQRTSERVGGNDRLSVAGVKPSGQSSSHAAAAAFGSSPALDRREPSDGGGGSKPAGDTAAASPAAASSAVGIEQRGRGRKRTAGDGASASTAAGVGAASPRLPRASPKAGVGASSLRGGATSSPSSSAAAAAVFAPASAARPSAPSTALKRRRNEADKLRDEPNTGKKWISGPTAGAALDCTAAAGAAGNDGTASALRSGRRSGGGSASRSSAIDGALTSNHALMAALLQASPGLEASSSSSSSSSAAVASSSSAGIALDAIFATSRPPSPVPATTMPAAVGASTSAPAATAASNSNHLKSRQQQPQPQPLDAPRGKAAMKPGKADAVSGAAGGRGRPRSPAAKVRKAGDAFEFDDVDEGGAGGGGGARSQASTQTVAPASTAPSQPDQLRAAAVAAAASGPFTVDAGATGIPGTPTRRRTAANYTPSRVSFAADGGAAAAVASDAGAAAQQQRPQQQQPKKQLTKEEIAKRLEEFAKYRVPTPEVEAVRRARREAEDRRMGFGGAGARSSAAAAAIEEAAALKKQADARLRQKALDPIPGEGPMSIDDQYKTLLRVVSSIPFFCFQRGLNPDGGGDDVQPTSEWVQILSTGDPGAEVTTSSDDLADLRATSDHYADDDGGAGAGGKRGKTRPAVEQSLVDSAIRSQVQQIMRYQAYPDTQLTTAQLTAMPAATETLYWKVIKSLQEWKSAQDKHMAGTGSAAAVAFTSASAPAKAAAATSSSVSVSVSASASAAEATSKASSISDGDSKGRPATTSAPSSDGKNQKHEKVKKDKKEKKEKGSSKKQRDSKADQRTKHRSASESKAAAATHGKQQLQRKKEPSAISLQQMDILVAQQFAKRLAKPGSDNNKPSSSTALLSSSMLLSQPPSRAGSVVAGPSASSSSAAGASKQAVAASSTSAATSSAAEYKDRKSHDMKSKSDDKPGKHTSNSDASKADHRSGKESSRRKSTGDVTDAVGTKPKAVYDGLAGAEPAALVMGSAQVSAKQSGSKRKQRDVDATTVEASSSSSSTSQVLPSSASSASSSAATPAGTVMALKAASTDATPAAATFERVEIPAWPLFMPQPSDGGPLLLSSASSNEAAGGGGGRFNISSAVPGASSTSAQGTLAAVTLSAAAPAPKQPNRPQQLTEFAATATSGDDGKPKAPPKPTMTDLRKANARWRRRSHSAAPSTSVAAIPKVKGIRADAYKTHVHDILLKVGRDQREGMVSWCQRARRSQKALHSAYSLVLAGELPYLILRYGPHEDTGNVILIGRASFMLQPARVDEDGNSTATPATRIADEQPVALVARSTYVLRMRLAIAGVQYTCPLDPTLPAYDRHDDTDITSAAEYHELAALDAQLAAAGSRVRISQEALGRAAMEFGPASAAGAALKRAAAAVDTGADEEDGAVDEDAPNRERMDNIDDDDDGDDAGAGAGAGASAMPKVRRTRFGGDYNPADHSETRGTERSVGSLLLVVGKVQVDLLVQLLLESVLPGAQAPTSIESFVHLTAQATARRAGDGTSVVPPRARLPLSRIAIVGAGSMAGSRAAMMTGALDVPQLLAPVVGAHSRFAYSTLCSVDLYMRQVRTSITIEDQANAAGGDGNTGDQGAAASGSAVASQQQPRMKILWLNRYELEFRGPILPCVPWWVLELLSAAQYLEYARLLREAKSGSEESMGYLDGLGTPEWKLLTMHAENHKATGAFVSEELQQAIVSAVESVAAEAAADLLGDSARSAKRSKGGGGAASAAAAGGDGVANDDDHEDVEYGEWRSMTDLEVVEAESIVEVRGKNGKNQQPKPPSSMVHGAQAVLATPVPEAAHPHALLLFIKSLPSYIGMPIRKAMSDPHLLISADTRRFLEIAAAAENLSRSAVARIAAALDRAGGDDDRDPVVWPMESLVQLAADAGMGQLVFRDI